MTSYPLVFHDMFMFPDGGGRVASTLANQFNAKLITGHLDADAFPGGWFGDVYPVSLQAYNIDMHGLHEGYRSHGAFRTFLPLLKFSKILQMHHALSKMPLLNPSWTIFSGSLSLLAHKRITGPKILYCHTPPRLLYDQRDFYLKQTRFLKRPAMKALMVWYQKHYEAAVRDMDLIIANSCNVQGRIKHYLGRDSVIVYPPCDVDAFVWLGQGDYYLSTARLDPLKRVDVVVKAFLQMPDKKLVVVSGGSEYDRIRAMAEGAANIKILGWVDDSTLHHLMGNCIATIYIPMDEDFGISPVESMAAGKPVIGVAEGGLLETIQNGHTGMLIPADPGPWDVVRAVGSITKSRARGMHSACEHQARKFRTRVFHDKMREIVAYLSACPVFQTSGG
ncbi:MAG: glycosyltransferase [Desulfamplus sp.]|nr:glycosyltransferase [Desulfamplus sp.]